jgi:uncharacterized protein YecA (UPF0149 family)
MKNDELYCTKCKDYTEHLEEGFKSCTICGSIYDETRNRYVITGPETSEQTIQAGKELLEKEPDAIIIPEEVAMKQRMKGWRTFPTTLEPKIQRNEPCPCGSGKKYKKCCINK